MAGVTGQIRVSPNKNPDPTQEIQEIQLIQPTGDLLTMCTLELEMACLDHKNTPVDPDPFNSLFIPHVPSFSTPCHRAQGALLNAAIQQAQGIHGHLCVAFGLQQSQLCQERPAASKTRFHGGP